MIVDDCGFIFYFLRKANDNKKRRRCEGLCGLNFKITNLKRKRKEKRKT
jgi:hypothetical protein